uniref:Fasciclin1like [Megachile rotundata] n=1 Tax=Lepeophtheirus salmonis TaxID=72036 RepID=A0A0K2UEZ8_LEPSM
MYASQGLKLLFNIVFFMSEYRRASCESIGELIEKHPNLTRFHQLLKEDGLHRAFMERSITIFAPSNEALASAQLSHRRNEDLILNHFTNLALKKVQLSKELTSLVTGNPRLWVKREGNNVFINQGRIINFDIQGVSPRGEQQVLHIIDSVLEPLLPLTVSSGNYFVELDARKLMSKSTLYDLNGHGLRMFNKQAEANRKSGMFSVPGRHTFFMPVDEAFEISPIKPQGLYSHAIKNAPPKTKIQPELISARVLEGHIVPNQLLFTNMAPTSEYPTVAWVPDGIKVNLSLRESNLDNEVLVRSHTIVGDPAHARGIVIANILRGNIPVENGIVHLIDKPLMIVDKTLFEYVRTEGSEPDNRIRRFADLIRDKGGLFAQTLLEAKDGTLLIPNNEAMDRIEGDKLNYILGTDYLRAEWFGLHFVRERLSSTDTRLRAMGEATYSVPASLPNNRVWFQVNDNRMSVETRGVNASMTEKDIGTINGVIHVIDRVLGIPYQSVGEKLSTNPQMSSMFSLLQKWNLEDLFYDNYTRITLLVPSNSAWAKADAHFSESIDSILSDNTLTKKLIERHLLIDSVACSFEELVERTRRSPRRKVCMKGSELEFAQIGEIAQLAYRDHIVKWEGDINAKVLRPNLECTNGYIHLIDTVLIDDAPPWVLMSYVSSSSTPGTFSSSCIHTIFSILFYMRSLL